MKALFLRFGATLMLLVGLILPMGAQAQFSGTNGQIFFMYTNSSGVDSIAAVNPDSSESHLVVTPATGSTLTFGQASPDGTKIVYIVNNTSSSIVIANANGSSPQTVYTSTANTFINSIHYSTDGLTLFYVASNNPTLTNNGIYSIPVIGGTPTQLVADSTATSTTHYDPMPTASKLYYRANVYNPSPGTHTIFSSNLDGTSPATIYTSSVHVSLLDISPDGTKLLMSEYNGANEQLITVNAVDGTGRTVIAATSGRNIREASFSPDGTKLAYSATSYNNTTFTTTNYGTTIVNADGTGTPAVLRSDAMAPAWSKVALAIAGTYPTALVNGTTTQTGSGSGGGGSGIGSAAAPSLPAAAKSTSSLPTALAILGLISVAVIETTRRVRTRRQS